MKPRSIVFDLFGDHLRYLGGQARMQALTDLLGTFDVPETTARVVLSRMRKEGWFTTNREGRATVYSLTNKSWRLLDEGKGRIFDRVERPWDSQWRMAIYAVAESDRSERERLRRALTWLGFGPLAASTWVSPHDRLDEVEQSLGVTSARLDLFTCRSRGPEADRDMARRCWDLDGLAADYAALVARLEASGGDRIRALEGPQALRRRIELIASYRTYPFRDPNLPAALLPAEWPGRRAHELFLAVHDALQPAADAYVRQVVAVGA